MSKIIVILATLDTKEQETAYIKELVEARGHRVLLIDGGILGTTGLKPDITSKEVAEAAGMSLEEVIALNHEGEAIATMAKGAALITGQLYVDGRLDGIIALGGTMGTSLGLAGMRDLPVGTPKVMLSTVGFTPFITDDVIGKDQVMVQPAADLWGINTITRMALENAAGAICGMVETHRKHTTEKPIVGLTTRGICHYPNWIKPLLEQKGYEVAVFHAVGLGGRTFEALIEQGFISASLDLTTGEVIEHLYGGTCSAGAHRLEAASAKGIPQIVSPGCMEYWDWTGDESTMPERFKGRKIHRHNPLVLCVKATPDEMAEAAKVMAQKVNMARGPVAVLIPLLGFDELNKPGGVFDDPEGNEAFINSLKDHLDPRIEIMELDMHINDKSFAETVVSIFNKLITGP